MVALQIRDVPDDVRRTLADRAAAAGQSLRAFLLAPVTEEAHRARNTALLQRFSGRDDGSLLSAAEAQHLLDSARAEREGQLQAGAEPR